MATRKFRGGGRPRKPSFRLTPMENRCAKKKLLKCRPNRSCLWTKKSSKRKSYCRKRKNSQTLYNPRNDQPE